MLADARGFFNLRGTTRRRRKASWLGTLSPGKRHRHHSFLEGRSQRPAVAYRVELILRLKMESTHPASEVTPPPAVVRKKKLRLKRRRRRMRPVLRYTIIGGAIVVLGVATQFAVHTYRTEPRNTNAIAARELRLNTLAEGERVIRSVPVFQRPWIDYFRATRGLLVLTDRRLLFLGLEPRDLLGSGDS